ncbi:MAG: acyl carrier protein [Candidatus Cloacimonetes bacterium]|nr:acyl carrier protein [Candidatus Cloacimonadota bacterium]
MTQEEFLLRLQEEVQLDRPLNPDEMLCDIQEWDSLAMLGTLSVFDEIGASIEIDELEECVSIKDILQKAGFES